MVHRDTAAVINSDVGTLASSAKIMLGFNATIRDAVVSVGASIERELDMQYERRMAAKVRRAVRTPFFQRLAVDVPDPVSALCGPACYAYRYVEGARVEPACADRLVLGFFRLLHGDGILLGDPNVGNFVQGSDGTIWILDFGSAAILSGASRQKLRRVHESGYDTARLAAALPGVPAAAVEATAKMTRAFWDPAAPIESPTILYSCMSCLATAQLDSDLVLAFRAIVILLCNLQEMGVTHLTCAADLPSVVVVPHSAPAATTQSTARRGGPPC
jgi:hypothetical protein